MARYNEDICHPRAAIFRYGWRLVNMTDPHAIATHGAEDGLPLRRVACRGFQLRLNWRVHHVGWQTRGLCPGPNADAWRGWKSSATARRSNHWETASHFWAHHRYEGGFNGILAAFRISATQRDWSFADGIRGADVAAAAPISEEDQREHELVKRAEQLFEAHNYEAALAACDAGFSF